MSERGGLLTASFTSWAAWGGGAARRPPRRYDPAAAGRGRRPPAPLPNAAALRFLRLPILRPKGQLPRSLTGAALPGDVTPGPPRGWPGTHREQGSSSGSGRHTRAAGGRGPLRPPDAPLEPQDAPLHLRRARRDPHHRPAADRTAAGSRSGVRGERRRPRRHDPVRRHEEAGARRGQGRGREVRACRTSTSAGSAVCSTNFQTISKRIKRLADLDQLGRGRHDGAAADARADQRPVRAREADDEPRRRPQPPAPAGRDVRRRPEDRGDRRRRGRAAEDPDHRPGRHQLRPRPGQLTSSPATTTRSARASWSRTRSATWRPSARPSSARRRRPPGARPRRRPAARPRRPPPARRPRSRHGRRPRRPARRWRRHARPSSPPTRAGRRAAAQRRRPRAEQPARGAPPGRRAAARARRRRSS